MKDGMGLVMVGYRGGRGEGGGWFFFCGGMGWDLRGGYVGTYVSLVWWR